MSFDFKISEGDFQIASDGDLQKVENTEKLVQDVLKICTAELGSNTLFPWYGSPISKTLVGDVVDEEFVNTVASSQLANSLETLRSIQQEQAKWQRVTPFEHISAIRNVSIQRNQVDFRFYKVIISVLTKAMSEASTSFLVDPKSVGL